MTDVLPAGVTLDGVTALGWICTGAQTVRCSFVGPLPAGTRSSVTLHASLAANYTGVTLSNTAVVSPVDQTPGDNTSTFVTSIDSPASSGGGGTFTGGGGTLTATPPTAGGFTGGGGSLAFTGSHILTWAADGAVLALVGLLLLLAGRRRTSN